MGRRELNVVQQTQPLVLLIRTQQTVRDLLREYYCFPEMSYGQGKFRRLVPDASDASSIRHRLLYHVLHTGGKNEAKNETQRLR